MSPQKCKAKPIYGMETKFCECQCGCTIPAFDAKGRPVRFVKGHSHKSKEYQNPTEKLCGGCKNLLPADAFHKRYSKSLNGNKYLRLRSRCKECETNYKNVNRKHFNEWHSQHRKEQKSLGNIKYWIEGRLTSFRKKTPESDLDTKSLVAIYEQQQGLCYYTGIKMVFSQGFPHIDGISLDKLDPTKGYNKNNVVFCCYAINTMKGARTEQEFYDTMKLILARKYEAKPLV